MELCAAESCGKVPSAGSKRGAEMFAAAHGRIDRLLADRYHGSTSLCAHGGIPLLIQRAAFRGGIERL
jgi:hypothetical protein